MPATEQPLTPAKEGFWGRIYPFARKKWVKRQIDPINDRLSELDEVNAKNAAYIKDVDERAQAGIHKAQNTADAANQLAMNANTEAQNANGAAQSASNHVNQINTTVNGLDQYHQASDLVIKFRGSSPVLTSDSKAALDQLASSLTGHEGYILEMEAHSPLAGSAGIQSSERLAEAVKRYLVTEHQIPVYRMHSVALGNEVEMASTANRRSKPKAGAGTVQQCASECDGKQFGGPGRSVTPKRSCRSRRGAAVISGQLLPRGSALAPTATPP